MVHKPEHKVHSFRNLINDDGSVEIELERQNLNVAYRIVKFNVIPVNPGVSPSEAIIKVYRENTADVTTPSITIDFSDTNLIAAAYCTVGSTAGGASTIIVIFDNVLFSRNIYVTYKDGSSETQANFYLEIEEVPVSASALMQLKLGVARRLNLEQ